MADMLIAEEKLRTMRAALELVLMFFTPDPWTLEKRNEWTNKLCTVHGEGITNQTLDATTRTLCNAIKEALK